MQCQTSTNVLLFGECSCLRHWNHLCSWERITQNTFHQKYRARSHYKEDVRHFWKVDSRTIRWHFWCVSNQLARFSMETMIFGQWWRSHQSLACKGLFFQILCYVLERWVKILHQMLSGKNSWVGWKIHHNTEFWTQLTGSRWNLSGIFPRIHYIAARRQSPRVHEQNGRRNTIPRTNYLHVDVQWHHMKIYGQWTGMYC